MDTVSPAETPATASASRPETSPPEDPSSTAPTSDGREVHEQHVDLGEFADEPQAVAAARFYEALWTSYQRAEMTGDLARLTSDSARGIFRERIKDYRKAGHTVADLTAARITQVQGGKVFVCMASSSYQRLEADNGAAVEPAEKGFTQYVVTMQNPKPPWTVDTIQGTMNHPCGKADS